MSRLTLLDFANCDHLPAAEAIIRGLARRQADTPAFLIHTSGTMILAWETFEQQSFGETRSKVYNDWDGINELTSFPDKADHRHVDKVILAASKDHPGKIQTAIVCPPTIYGQGRGPDNQRSLQVPLTTMKFLQFQQAGIVGKGQNVWYQVHVQDLARLYLLLGEAAAAGGPPATWDDQGYYLAENGAFVWGDVLTAIAKEAHKQGLLPSPDVKPLSGEEFNQVFQFKYGKAAVGTDSQGQAIRARKLLDWQPKEKSLLEEIPFVVTDEAKSLGLIRGHAEKVAE